MMTITLKKFAVAGFVALLVLTGAMFSVRAGTSVDEPAVTYKAKCFACHGAKADKKWDSTRPDDQMVESILKGKKAAAPPNMPAFAEKGIDADQARALIAYMKSLKG